MHDTSTYYTTYFFLNFPEKCTYYNKMVYIVLNDGHGIFGVIFFCGVLGQPLTFAPFCEKKESLLHRSTDKMSTCRVVLIV